MCHRLSCRYSCARRQYYRILLLHILNYCLIKTLPYCCVCVCIAVSWGCICSAVNLVCDKTAETLYQTEKTLTPCSGRLSLSFRLDKHPHMHPRSGTHTRRAHEDTDGI